MSTQTADYPVAQTDLDRHTPSYRGHAQRGDTTDRMTTLDLEPLRPSLVDAWVKALRAAESLHQCLHPTYLRRSEAELVAFVKSALRGHREPSQLVADLLAPGSRR
jgi:hypothetical protein